MTVSGEGGEALGAAGTRVAPSEPDAGSGQLVHISVPVVDRVFEAIIQAAKDPSMNVDNLTQLFALQKELRADHERTAFHAAMNAAQAEIQPVARTSENKQTGSMFAKLEAVDAAIRPIYLRYGFSLSYDTAPPLTPGNIRMECRCSRGGHTETFHREAPADTLGPKGSPTKTALHGGASTETFLKRYMACGIFNVVFKNMDDDGVRGGRRFITAPQSEELRALMARAKRQEGPFLDRLFGGSVHSCEEIEAGAFVVVKNTLASIVDQQAKKDQG